MSEQGWIFPEMADNAVPTPREVRVPAKRLAHGSASGVEFRRSGSLIDRALERLAPGRLSTRALADEVLRLRWNPRVASAAVFTLLGSDPRVRVDGCGMWA